MTPVILQEIKPIYIRDRYIVRKQDEIAGYIYRKETPNQFTTGLY
jgi:hypothetical protein